MAEIAFFGITVIGFALPLFALRRGKEWLIALLPIYLITGNVFAESFINVFGFMTSLAIPVYAATFLVTDTLSEHFGRADAKRAVFVGFMGQVMFLAVSLVVTWAPVFPDNAEKFEAVFGLLPRLVVGSFTAYLVSQFWDIQVFHVIRDRTGRGKLWFRNIVSTSTSQLLDTTIFLFIAFWGVLPNFWAFLLTTWIFKVVVALIDTPYLYATRRVIGERKVA